MRIAFFASGISPHISEMCDEIYKRIGDKFRFFATDKSIAQSMYVMGAGNLHKEKLYYFNVNESREYAEMSLEWARNAEVAIVGCSNCYCFIEERMRAGNGLTLKLKERLFKNGIVDYSDEKLNYKIKNQYLKYADRNVYYLCAGTFTPIDFINIGIPYRKLIKWGYFPKKSICRYEDFTRVFDEKITFIWVGRFVREKLVMNVITTAEKLISKGYDIELRMIGYGEEEQQLRMYVKNKGLSARISFLGAKTEAEIRSELQKAHIFLMTSNYEEGWGAVLNEAMSEGCVPVTTFSAGASAWLLESGNCGVMFQYTDLSEMEAVTEYLLNHRKRLEIMSRNAYEQIQKTWNAQLAVERLWEWIRCYFTETDLPVYDYGPCGKIYLYENEASVKELIDNEKYSDYH